MKRAAIITASDSGYRGEREDLSGPAIREILEREGYEVISMDILPDDQVMLAGKLQEIADSEKAELILTTFHYGEVVAQGDRQDLPYVADYKAYIKEFMDQSHPDEVLFVTGSLYFIAEVRAFLLEG